MELRQKDGEREGSEGETEQQQQNHASRFDVRPVTQGGDHPERRIPEQQP